MALVYDVGASADLAGQAAGVSGSGTTTLGSSLIYATGTSLAIIARPATIAADISVGSAGPAKLVHDLGTIVSLVAQSASVFTTNGPAIEDIGTPAELIAQSARMAGIAKAVKAGVGALTSQRAAVGTTSTVVRNGTGGLSAQGASVFGVSERQIITGGAGLAAQAAVVSSVTRKTNFAAGALLAGDATIAVSGGPARKGDIILTATSADITGFGGVSTVDGPVGSGDLYSTAAQLDVVARVIRFAVGGLLAGEAEVAASGKKEITGRGQLKADPAYVALDSASGDLLTWEMDDTIWGQPSVIHARDWPVFAKENQFFQADFGQYFDKEPVRVVLERTGLSILGRDRQGNWKVNAGVIKFISGVWPYLKGTPGTEVLVYVGSQMNTEEAITWEGPYKAIIGQTEFLDFTVSGRYMAVRFESVGQPPWELVSYDLDLTTVGER